LQVFDLWHLYTVLAIAGVIFVASVVDGPDEVDCLVCVQLELFPDFLEGFVGGRELVLKASKVSVRLK